MTRFITLDGEGQHNWWRVLLVLAGTIALAVAASLFFNIILMPQLRERFFPEAEMSEVLWWLVPSAVGVMFTAIGLALLLLTKMIHRRPASTLFTQSGRRFLCSAIVWGAIVQIVGMVAIAFFLDPESLADPLDGRTPTMFILAGVIAFAGFTLQGGTEEVFFRAYLPQVLFRWIKNPAFVVLVPSLIFAVGHGGYGLENFLSSLIFALSFAAVVFIRGNLAEAIGAHAANNAMVIWFFNSGEGALQSTGLQVNPVELLYTAVPCALLVSWALTAQMLSSEQ
ncbi:MAG: CPBP family intramembrane metalloprotease [Parvularculaceae bacterium]|nr:CPBP family intramembrane metalloprotease [Parvularculaceae bacterium]